MHLNAKIYTVLDTVSKWQLYAVRRLLRKALTYRLPSEDPDGRLRVDQVDRRWDPMATARKGEVT